MFDQQVAKGYYAPLSEFDQIDFGLLKTEVRLFVSFNFIFTFIVVVVLFSQQEEWQMFFVYIIGFPSMLERCVNGIENGQISIHLVCTFLSCLSALFSVYYYRVKILTVNTIQHFNHFNCNYSKSK